MKRLTTAAALAEHDLVPGADAQDLERVTARYALGLSPFLARLIKKTGRGSPLARQYVPTTRELDTTPEERADPIGDDAHSPVKGIVHRYPDRVLLKPVHACAVYCRFCFRREMVGPGQDSLDAAELEAALDYIRARNEIWEVILTGGDPLILSPRRLRDLLRTLQDIPHVKILRIHTRVPAADPARVTPQLLDALVTDKPLYICIHVNHAQELAAEPEAAIAALRRAGCILLSQSVLLKDVNDTPDALEDLFRRLLELGVKPYYLHHPDLAPGTGHFRLPVSRGRAIMRALRGKLSGLAQPAYVLDIPGGYGKVPVGPDYLHGDEIEDVKGALHAYPPA